MKYYCKICDQWLDETEVVNEKTYHGIRTDLGMQVEPDEYDQICPICFSSSEYMVEGENCSACDETFPKEELEVFEGNLYCKKCLEEK